MNRWEEARAGTGQAVLLSGEAGIGKSRLLRALRERVSEGSGDAALRWLSLHGSPYTQNTPLHPVVNLLKRTLASWPGASALEQLDALLRAFSLSEALPLFASLLDLPLSDRPPLPPMPPERQREQTLEALVALLLEMSEREPVILLAEDLHWLDAEHPRVARAPDQYDCDGPVASGHDDPPQHPGHTVGIAGPRDPGLDARRTRSPGNRTAHPTPVRGGPLRPEVQQHIVAQTDGVPLFVEELTRSALEAGDSGEWREFARNPSRLADRPTRPPRDRQGSGPARLGHRPCVPAQTARGGRFPHSVDTLERELRRLVQSGLVHRRGFGAQTRYSFKHALVRDAAYDSLLRRERQQIHLRIATAMDEEKRAGGEETAQSEEIAHHYMAGERSRPRLRVLARAWQAGDRPLGPYRSNRTLPARAASP